MLNILIVDDEKDFRVLLKIILKRAGYNIIEACDGIDAINVLKKENIDVVLTDLVMDKCDGITLLKHISENYSGIETIIMTAYGTIENAVEAMKLGAFSYFIKSNNPEEILFNLEKIEKFKKLHIENKYLKDAIISDGVILDSKNKAFIQAVDYAKRAADSNSNILILGESGVGKEIFAKFIHANSPRKDNVFLAVNCYSFSDSLIESELYGHENGSFTGATGTRIGRFEASDKGTLFLDEVGDLPESTQVKILRNIENREITRIGSNKTIKTDFRLISATHKDINKAIKEKKFREDLYYRLSTVVIDIPPLRERTEDIPVLIEYFTNSLSISLKKPFNGMDKNLSNFLYSYEYPGNVREMKNIIERLFVLSTDGVLKMEDGIKFSYNHSDSKNESLKSIRTKAERNHIVNILEKFNYDFNKAAEVLEISSRQLYNKCNEYDIKKDKIPFKSF